MNYIGYVPFHTPVVASPVQGMAGTAYRATPTAGIALVQLPVNGGPAELLAGVGAVLTQLQSDVASWAGNPTTLQAAQAVDDARALMAVMERIHSATSHTRKGA